MKIKKFEAALIIAFILSIISCVSFEGRCKNIRKEVMRLHIIASSDERDDQEVKLKIRDEILKESGEIFKNSKDILEAKSLSEGELSALEETARRVLRENGKEDEVKAYVGKSFFPTRQYENITLPAGNYTALKIIVGKGEGKNWWCVLFPPLCLSAAKKDGELLESVLSKSEMELVKSNPKFEVRFWIIEKWQELISR